MSGPVFVSAEVWGESCAEIAKRQRDNDACSLALGRMDAATRIEGYGDYTDVLGLGQQREAFMLLWRCRLLSVEEAEAIAGRYILAAEAAKSTLRKALA